MEKRISQRGTDGSRTYVAQPANQSLVAYLVESLKVLEMRFDNLDQDGAGSLSFDELTCELSIVGFYGGANLQQAFTIVDRDRNGTLDFAEFLELIYWFVKNRGELAGIFQNPVNSSVVNSTFQSLEKCLSLYDRNNNLQMSREELEQFFKAEFQDVYASGLYHKVVVPELPTSEVTVAKVLHLIYLVCCHLPGSSIQGKYRTRPTPFIPGQVGDKSALWNQLRSAFQTLEVDFKNFDKNGDLLVQKEEITQGIPLSKPNSEKVVIFSCLQQAFMACDADQSGALDFFEFMYLCFDFSSQFPYRDLIATTSDCAGVKRAFLDISSVYRQFDRIKDNRLEMQEIMDFFQAMFGEIPRAADAAWNACKKMNATIGKECVDLPGFMKVLYMVTLPEGQFHPNKYNPTKSRYTPQMVSLTKAVVTAHPPRIQNVQLQLFKPDGAANLGEGGQGKVRKGTYNGIPCAGKTYKGDNPGALQQELLKEANFFTMVDHPNCHFMLGAKTTVEPNLRNVGFGLLQLTEICENGSLFDYFNRNPQRRLDNLTSLRIARESASGLDYMHNRLGFMHRDIKSMNIFMDKNLVAKVADFGMVTREPTSVEGAGTIQWAAPEVLPFCFPRGTFQQMFPPYDKRCDYYSYAILLWEIFHRMVPYAETRWSQEMIGRTVVQRDIRPTMNPAICPREIAEIIQRCWDRAPEKRLTFPQIIQKLDAAAATIR